MPLNVGEIVGDRYRVIKLLGQGGMGAVYQAWDTRLNRPVAAKEMSPQAGLESGALAELRGQFKQEAQILATLVHTNLVRVTDYFSWRGNEYLVMDFVEGESLANRIQREGPQGEAQTRAWSGQLLEALAYCHGQGVIHRDIKPHNIIVAPDGRAVLVDFGLVKLWDPSDPRTRTVMRGMGTPEYAPPEQYDIGPGHTDPRSDIYGLGATLYHALSGQLPPTATQRMANPTGFMPLRRINPSISPAMDGIVLKAMEIPMDRRFQSAAGMARALGFALRTAPPRSRPATAKRRQARPTTTTKTGRRGKGGVLLGLGGAGLVAVGVGCLLLTVVAVVIGIGLMDGNGTTSITPTVPPVAPTSPPTATESAATAPTATPPLGEDGNIVFEDDFSSSASGWEAGDYDTGSVGYTEEAYFVTSFGDGHTMWGVANRSFDNVMIDVQAKQVSAPANNNNGYGVMCREQGTSNATGYLFLVSGDGHYSIVKSVDGEFEWLVQWTPSELIRQGNTTNRIVVFCDGPSLGMYADGELLASVEDSSYTSGDIALAAVSLEENESTEIHFDDLVVTSWPSQ